MLSNPNAGEELSDRWIEHMGPYCPELVEYVDEHQDEYEAIIVVTYLYYTAVKSIVRIKNKAIFIPTAHQEPFIHFDMYKRYSGLLMRSYSLQTRKRIWYTQYSIMKMFHTKYAVLV